MEKRMIFLDRLKVYLTVLVIFHHTAITYGGSGGWFYYEHQDNVLVNTVLTLFTAVNQSYFMGLFFFISGFVTPASYDRQGGVRFLRARLMRFGIPLLFYMLIIAPLLGYVSSGYSHSLGVYMMNEVIAHPFRGVTEFAIGPLWYLFALLLFFIGYTVYRYLTTNKNLTMFMPKLTTRLMISYVVIVAALNFIVRLAYPVGTEVLNLQLAYFPAYVGLFMAGIAAYRGNWMRQFTKVAAWKWTWSVIFLFLLMLSGMALGGAMEGDIAIFMGGMSWQSAFYSMIDPLMGLGISYMLIVWFRESWNKAATTSTRLLTTNAFLVYILHALFVTYVAYYLQNLQWNPMMKFICVGSIAALASYTVASLMRQIPWVKKVV